MRISRANKQNENLGFWRCGRRGENKKCVEWRGTLQVPRAETWLPVYRTIAIAKLGSRREEWSGTQRVLIPPGVPGMDIGRKPILPKSLATYWQWASMPVSGWARWRRLCFTSLSSRNLVEGSPLVTLRKQELSGPERGHARRCTRPWKICFA